MAILKHLAIKKKDYSDIQQYLIFKCEEGTHRPLRDETGHMIQRDFFIQSGMSCNAYTFDAECVKLNHQFHKNNHKGDIMAHHFIISFDPKDAADHGLTPHKAHALAKEFAEYFFAGHQALIVTHADGNNHAGNIHTHIVINSLRKEKVEWQSFIENPRDCLPGYKHHLTDGLLHRMHERLGEICEREHLYTVEIDQPTDKKVTDREYQAQLRGQKEKDIHNAYIRADGYEPIHLTYETTKQLVRNAVDDAASRAGTELEFFNILRRDYSIRVNLKRGRYSYVHPDSEKPYTARSLGNAYSREVILEKLRVNRQPVVDDRPEVAALPRIFLIPSDMRLIVDLQSCVKAQQSRAYAQKVTISNIQKMADTVSWLEKNKMNSLDQLTAAKRDLTDRYYDTENDLRHVKNELVEVNQKIKHVGRYLSNKKVYTRYQAAEDKDAFRAEYRSQIEAYEESLKALDELFMGDDPPSLKELKEKKSALVEKRDRLQAEYNPLAAEMRNMKVVWKNVCYILGRQAELEKQEQRERARPAPEQPPRKRRREMSL